ncbi:MAG: hypothetical protein NVS1B10_05840 [Candidatus Saccharimonadales bacterium]
MRWNPDWSDRLCIGWAEQRRKALGIVLGSKLTARERLGKLNCTLGAVHDEGEGAAYTGKTQNWPEVYLGVNLVVHRCWNQMPRPWAEVMHIHYVWREVRIQERAPAIQLNLSLYYQRLYLLKIHVNAFVEADENGIDMNTLEPIAC